MTVADAPPMVTLALTYNTPTVTPLSTLTATATTSDADGDPVTLTYVWTRSNPSTPAPTIDVQTTPTSGTTTSLTDLLQVLGNAQPGQTITVTVTPSEANGFEPAPPSPCRCWSAPRRPRPRSACTPTTATVGTALTATVATADLNGLPVTLEYDWFYDNGTGRMPLQTTAGVTSLSDTLTPTNLAKLAQGDIVSVDGHSVRLVGHRRRRYRPDAVTIGAGCRRSPSSSRR